MQFLQTCFSPSLPPWLSLHSVGLRTCWVHPFSPLVVCSIIYIDRDIFVSYLFIIFLLWTDAHGLSEKLLHCLRAVFLAVEFIFIHFQGKNYFAARTKEEDDKTLELSNRWAEVNCAVAAIKIWNGLSQILSVAVPICGMWHTALHREQSCIFAANITQHGSSKAGYTQHARDK